MVTDWKEYWDQLPNGQAYYTKNMFKGKMNIEKIKDCTPTLFIKINKSTGKFEKMWKGFVYNFKIEANKIKFKVKIDGEVENFPQKYLDYSKGWYIEEIEEEIPCDLIFFPPFLYILEKTNDWEKFEEYTYVLLKMVGIHKIIKFKKQKGTADGFFKIRNFAVIYDCTLKGEFENEKKQQIKNYLNQLKQSEIKFENKTTINIQNCTKQVWIITRGTNRIIEKVDDITIKEIPVCDIIKIFKERLLKENVDEIWLEKELREI